MKYNITFKRKSKWAIINPVKVKDCEVRWCLGLLNDNDYGYWILILYCEDGRYHHVPLRAIKAMTELEQADKDDELVIKLKDLLGNKYKSYENALEKQ